MEAALAKEKEEKAKAEELATKLEGELAEARLEKSK